MSTSEHDDMRPGDDHGWWMTGFGPDHVVSVTAQSLTNLGDEAGNPLIHELEVVSQSVATSEWPTFNFTVRNVGATAIPAYLVSFAIVSP
jgi:hypothetical protein